MSRIGAVAGQVVTFAAVIGVALVVGMTTASSPAGAGAGDAVDLYEPEVLKANGATLRWSRYTGPSGAPFDRYEVHRSETAGFTPSASTLLTTIRDVDVTGYTDTTADSGRPFSYKVVANASASNEVRPSLPIAGRARLSLQPNPAAGKASYLQKSGTAAPSCANHGTSGTLFLGGAGGEVDRPVLQFDLHEIPAKATVTEATLSVYRQTAIPSATTIDAHRVRSDWEEGTSPSACAGNGASWDEAQSGVSWGQDGGDLAPTPAASTTVAAGAAAAWDAFDVKSAVQQWADGAVPNNGFALKARNESSAPMLTYVSDDTATFVAERPKFVVKYDDASNDPSGPTVEFKSLLDSDLVTGASVDLGVEAGDDRRVERVEYYVDDVLVGSDTSAPWGITWDSRTVTNATHTLKAKAFDDVGNTGSETLSVTVANTAAPTTRIVSPSSSYVDVVKAEQPAAYWRLGEASGATATDSSGASATGTLSGSYLRAQTGQLTGDTDKATAFQNAATDGRMVASLAGKLPSAVTAEAWVNYAGTSVTNGVNRVVSRGWGSSGGWLLGLTKGGDGQQRAFFSVNAGGTEYRAAAVVAPGKLHLVGRYSGSEARLFVNGVDVAGVSAPSVGLNTSASVTVGGTLEDTITVDEVSLYGSALTGATAAMRYEVGSGRSPVVSGNAMNAVADASDDRGVDKVEFFVDGNYIGTDTSAPFADDIHTTIAGDEIHNGQHNLTSRAYDAEGQLKESATQTFRVDNAGGSPAFNATLATATDPPAEMTYVPAPATPDPAGFDIDVTNTGNATWTAADVVLRPRWIAPDGAVTEQSEVSLGSDLPAGQTRRRTVTVTPPPLPEGTTKAQYALRVDVYRKSSGTYFASKGNKPCDKPVVVHKADGELGLEDWLQYDGEELGGGMQHLVNLATGNSIVRMTPMGSTGRGLSTVLDITYNAHEDRSESPLGDNWSLSISGLTRFGTPLDIHPNGADAKGGTSKRYIDLTDGDGTVHRFTGKQAGDGSVYWEEPAGVHLYLRSTSSPDPARKWAITRPDGVTFYFDPEGYPTSVEDKNGNRITYTLQTVPPGEDPGGQRKRITAVTDAAGRAYAIAYYSKAEAPKPRVRGRIASIKDHSAAAPGPAGVNELRFEYYDDGNLRRISQVAGRRATGARMDARNWFFTYTTSSGSGPAIPDPAARQVPDPHVPNQSTRLFSVRDPRRHESTFAYRGPGGGQQRWNLTSRTDRLGKVTSYAYDTATRITTVTAPLDRIWKYAFDANRQVTKITNPLGEDTLVAWTTDRHVQSVTTPTTTGTATQTFGYNQNGQLTAVTNEENEQTQFAYTDLAADASDVAGKWKAGRTVGHLSRLKSKTAPKGVATTAVPDDFQWSFDYDSQTSLGNLVKVTDPERKATTLVPNADGTVASITDPNGNVRTYAYDPSGQPSQVSERVSDSETRITRFGYDADGFLIWLQDPAHAGDTGADTRSYRTYFDYDTWHRPGRESTPKSTRTDRGLLIWTDRRHNGNDGVEESYGPHYARQWQRGGALDRVEFDWMDRPERAYGPDTSADPQGERWRFSYDDAGRLVQATDPRGMADLTSDVDGARFFRYDKLDRLTRTARNEVNGATVVRTLYDHNCYDKAGDLVATIPPSAGKSDVTCGALNASDKATRMTYDKAHRPLTEQLPGKAPRTTTYDDNGNVATSTDEENVTTTLSYDQRDLPIKLVTPFKTGKDLVARRQYDDGGRLIREASPRAVDHLGDRATYAETDNHVTSYTYNGVDELTRVRLPDGPELPAHYVHRRYDPNGNLASASQPVESATSAPDERRTDVSYFDTGWIRSIDRPGRHTRDQPARRTVFYDYTAEGWQERMTPKLAGGGDDIAHQRTWRYYADGMLKEQLNGEGHQLDFFRYNANNALTFAHDSSGISDDSSQRPIELTVDYDSLNRPVKVRQSDSERDPGAGDWNVTTMGHHVNGTLAERIDNRLETTAGATVKAGQRHTFAYDDADWLTSQTDYSSPSDTTPERIIETLYKPTGRLSERKVTKSGTLRQSTAWDYFLDGDLKTMVTKAGSPLTVRESHTISYQEDGDSGPYVNGHRTRDVWRRDSPKTSAPCQTSDCTTSYTYDARDRLLREVRDRGTQDRTTSFTLTPSGSVSTETVETDAARTRFESTYVGDQLRLRRTLEPDGAGGWRETPAPQDDFRYWYEPATGNLDCVTFIEGGDDEQDCNAREGTTVSADLVADYAYDSDDKLRSARKWAPGRALDPVGDDQDPSSVAIYDYDALDRPVTEREHHPYKGRWSQPRLSRFSYLGTSDDVSQEQQLKLTTLQTPIADAQLDETKTYSYDPGGWRVGLTDVKKGQNGAPDETRNYLYGYDPHNNVTQLLSEAGAVRASYGYTVYGDKDKQETFELKHAGTPGTDDTQFTDDLEPLNPYRYTDKRYDSGSGQFDMGARRYGPDVGQFLQEDTLRNALGELGLSTDPLTQNRYSLAAGNPVSFVELDGHGPAYDTGATAKAVGDARQKEYARDAETYTPEDFRTDTSTNTPTPKQVVNARNQARQYTNNTTRSVANTPRCPNGCLRIDPPRQTPGEAIHDILSTCGILFSPCDAGDAAIYGGEGNEQQAALSSLGLIPFAKEISTGASAVRKAAKAPRIAGGASGLTDDQRAGILREAFQRKGNFGVGSATRADADQLGRDFVGPGFTRSRSNPDILISADGLRKYRPSSFKPSWGGYQANLERRFEPGGRFNSNAHIDILDP